jgi:hypothetical protein
VFHAEGRPDQPGAANGPGARVRGVFQPRSENGPGAPKAGGDAKGATKGAPAAKSQPLSLKPDTGPPAEGSVNAK